MNSAHSFRVCVLSAALLGLAACSTIQPPTPQPVAIEDVIRQVKTALTDVQTQLANRDLPPLKQVTLSLQTGASKKAGASLKLWVLGVGDTYENDRTQQIDLVLTPPPPPPKTKAFGIENLSITGDLEAAILSAAEGIAKSDLGGGPVRLVPTGLTVTLAFTVQNAANGSANVVISPVTAGVTGSLTQTATQKLTVVFGETKSSPSGTAAPGE